MNRTSGGVWGASCRLTLPSAAMKSGSLPNASAFWASWADWERHPAVAAQLINQLDHAVTPISRAASDSAHQLTGVREYVPPSSKATHEPDQFEFSKSRDGREHEVASRVEESSRDVLFTRMSPRRSGSHAFPRCILPNMQGHEEAQLFRVTLLRRLHQPFP